MATTFKWNAPEAIATYYTTELNSLANATFVAVGAEIANETGLYPYITFELVLASLSPTAGAFVDVWIDYQPDGTNYSDAAKPLQTSSLLCTIPLDTTASTAQRINSQICGIMPMDFKLQIRNMAGVAFGASGNSLKYRRFYDQGV
jgi:hypothetical protein